MPAQEHQEYVILVDDQDNETGVAEKIDAHQQNLLHRAFSVFIFRQGLARELLLQQRALSKYHSPGLWTNTCCSHPRKGEPVIAAGERRLKEELGIQAPLINKGWFHYMAHFSNGLSENEIDHVLIGTIGQQQMIYPNLVEVQTYRWVTVENLQKELAVCPDQFTPWLEKALKIALF